MAITDPGLSRSAQREAAQEDRRPSAFVRMAEHDLLQFLAGSIIAVVALVLWYSWDGSIVFALVGLWFAFEKISNARSNMSLSLSRPGIQAENLVLRRACSLATYLIARDFFPSVESYVIALTVGAASGYLHIVARLPSGLLFARPMVSTIRGAANLWLMSIATMARSLEPTVATQVLGAAAAAPFVAIFRMAGPLRMVAASLAAAVMPEAARQGKRTRQISSIIVLSMTLHGGVFLAMGIFAEESVALMLGPSYEGAGNVLRIYLVGMWMSTGSSLINAFVQGVYRERVGSIVSWVTLAVALTGVVTGATVWGPEGAALGASLAYAVQFALLIVIYRQRNATDIGHG